MRVNPNSEPFGVTRTPSQTGARDPRLGADQLSFSTAETLNRALEQTPATRAEKVERARSLADDASYPPPELIRKISALIALHVDAQKGLGRASLSNDEKTISVPRRHRNMIATHPLQSYKKFAAQTAPPGQLVVMLYEGAIRFLERALAGFQHDDPLKFNATIHNNVIRAQEIINELNGSLDLKQGGELAATLRRLYNHMDRQLTLRNARKTPEEIRDALRRLSTLRDAWREMLLQQDGAQSKPEPFPALAARS